MTACGLLTCVAGTVCMEDVCLCQYSHLMPAPDGSCPPAAESTQALNHSGVVHRHMMATILGADLVNNQTLENITNYSQNSSGEHGSPSALPVMEWEAPILLASVSVAAGLIVLLLRLSRTIYTRVLTAKVRRRQQVPEGNEMLLERMGTIRRSDIYHPTVPVEEPPQASDGLHVLSPDRLHLETKIGDGAFGTVFKGWLAPDKNGEEAEHGRHKIVAVKTQRGNSDRARQDFQTECRILASLHHVNILTFYGVVYSDDCPGSIQLVTDFATHGDLATALRKNDPTMRDKDENYLHLDYVDLLLICRQVAAGMEYLSAAHFVHRDLAARNCLIADGLVVKISDFGMSRDIHASDDYKVGGSRLLPVRWMSPECLRYGRFTVQSDVWAFGVLLWEVYTYGHQPHCGLNNFEVMERVCKGELLGRPKQCPNTVRKVMKGCWRMKPADRPGFARIRKLLASIPDDDVLPKPYVHDDDDTPTSSVTSESDLLQE